MIKVVYNACHGGFALSPEAVRLAKQYAPDCPHWQKTDESFGFYRGPRHDATLVRVVEELGVDAAGGSYSELAIAEIESGERYRIDEYDGYESVMTPDEYEWTVAP